MNKGCVIKMKRKRRKEEKNEGIEIEEELEEELNLVRPSSIEQLNKEEKKAVERYIG